MKAGEPIWYLQHIRGGYGYDERVPGHFVRATRARYVVRILLKSGAGKNIAVHPLNVCAREKTEAWR